MIEQLVTSYLEAIERRHGIQARENTRLEYRGGTCFFLKRHDAYYGQLVDIASLKMMTRRMHA